MFLSAQLGARLPAADEPVRAWPYSPSVNHLALVHRDVFLAMNPTLAADVALDSPDCGAVLRTYAIPEGWVTIMATREFVVASWQLQSEAEFYWAAVDMMNCLYNIACGTIEAPARGYIQIVAGVAAKAHQHNTDASNAP